MARGRTLLNLGSTNTTVGTAPVITGIVDDGNADSATVSITGDGTIQLYYRVQGDANWITGDTRTNSGDIVQAGLDTPNWYEFYATASPSGIESAPSNLETIYIAGVSTFTIEQALFQLLDNNAGVTALVASRIYPNYVPQGAAMPAVTYQQISAPRDNTFDGPSGLVASRFQFDCWTETYEESRDLADAVRKAIAGFTGTIGQTRIQGIMQDDEGDRPVIKAGTDVLRRMNKSQDYNIWFEEQTA